MTVRLRLLVHAMILTILQLSHSLLRFLHTPKLAVLFHPLCLSICGFACLQCPSPFFTGYSHSPTVSHNYKEFIKSPLTAPRQSCKTSSFVLVLYPAVFCCGTPHYPSWKLFVCLCYSSISH